MIDWNFNPGSSVQDDISEQVEEKKSRRRTTKCIELSKKYEYRRAFSEVSLLDACDKFKFVEGHSYHFITAGDVDSLSYLKAVLRQQNLDHLLLSTWCMAAEDILQLTEWYDKGKILKIDMYLGEIFPNSYRVEWKMIKDFYADHPDAGRAAVFRNHSKIFAGAGKRFSFGIETSANINTNPRTEQGVITIDDELYRFYKDYFDGIKSFEDDR